ncbi:MAG: SDR family NAD(P)-dependent oxidoreductase, partial [Lentisphaerae bacterium]|nr:SDR family NAD(P)-dependent oxidoreductase [Lentisphaerota bacterium]
MDCRNKKVIITGGSCGYGYGMAKVLKQRGAEVLITGRRLQVLEQAAKQLGVAYVQADVCNPDDWNRVFEANGPRLDVLVNN